MVITIPARTKSQLCTYCMVKGLENRKEQRDDDTHDLAEGGHRHSDEGSEMMNKTQKI